MNRDIRKLVVMCVVLGLGACATQHAADDVSVRQECECSCTYTALQGGVTPGERVGTFTFASDSPDCPFTAVDRYVACKDAQGNTHAGTRYYDCSFKGVAPPLP
jgi:hypothetical protein